MTRLPPASMASLPSAFFSFLLHGGVVIATLLSMPQAERLEEMTKYTIVPIDLVEMSDTTELMEVAAAMQQAEEETSTAEESDAAPAPAPPPVDEDTVSFDPPKEQPKVEPAKENKAAPAPSKSMADEIEEMLKGIEKDSKPSKANANTAPASSSTQPSQMGKREVEKQKATILDIIATQLVKNGCWGDHSDMADAKRLRATYRFSFARNGKFAIRPTPIDPKRRPASDPPLNTYMLRAERALNQCNTMGWIVPEGYFRLSAADQIIEFTFLTSLGADQ